MFSGIVEEVGIVEQLTHRRGVAFLCVTAQTVLDGTRIGDSIAFNGTCLTVTHIDATSVHVEMVPETLRRTNLGDLQPGSRVNLERSLAVGARIGGHFVQGHVDEVGRVESLAPEGGATIISFSASTAVMRYIVAKGFIAIDGMSLTVVERKTDSFTVSFIPHTLENTTASEYRPGAAVNLEADILGKYVESFLFAGDHPTPTIDRGFLAEHGFVKE